MTLQIADRVKETTATTGTGALSLAGAATGFRAFSSVCANADTCYYALQGVNSSGAPSGDWEVGLGTYNTSGNTLSRTTILASSNNGSTVNLSAATTQVWMDIPAAAVFGIGQTSQTLTTSRAVNATYTNTTNRLIQVTVNVSSTESTTSDVTLTGLTAFDVTATSTGYTAVFSGWVPPGATYGISGGGGVLSIVSWVEYR